MNDLKSNVVAPIRRVSWTALAIMAVGAALAGVLVGTAAEHRAARLDAERELAGQIERCDRTIADYAAEHREYRRFAESVIPALGGSVTIGDVTIAMDTGCGVWIQVQPGVWRCHQGLEVIAPRSSEAPWEVCARLPSSVDLDFDVVRRMKPPAWWDAP